MFLQNSDKARFHNLLELANSSKFDGEKKNALAAADRIAKKYGKSLKEFAIWQPPEKNSPHEEDTSTQWHQSNWFARMTSNNSSLRISEETQKAQWQSALEAAQAKGLNWPVEEHSEKPRRFYANNKTSRHPITHSRILLKETSLTMKEIADITGADFYDVVALKLKIRGKIGARGN